MTSTTFVLARIYMEGDWRHLVQVCVDGLNLAYCYWTWWV